MPPRTSPKPSRTRASARPPPAPDNARQDPALGAAYARLAELLQAEGGLDAPGTASGRKAFGATALKVRGKMFAMLAPGGFVVKLPRERVEALVAQGVGVPFEPGPGRRMKEWLTVVGPRTRWLPLAREARAFVRAAVR